MPLDPFALPDPFSGFTQPASRQQVSPIPQLSPDDEKSLLEKIGSAGLGGLSFLGGMLNKPGRAVRGLLGGTPREALNIIPFSDAMGITNPADEVRGQDLIGAKGADFFSPEGLAGFGVDVLTDPLTYMSFGGSALSKAGVLAKKAGTLPATVAERAAQGLGWHVGVGLPFAGNAATFNLAPLGNSIQLGAKTAASYIPGGTAALDALGAGANAVGDLYTKTIPPLFQKSAMGQTNAAAQDVAREVSAGIPGVQAAARQRVGDITGLLPESGLTQNGARDLRQGLETLGAPSGELAPAINAQRTYQSDLLSRLRGAGFDDKELADSVNAYAPRQATIQTRSEANALEASMRPAGQLAREEILKNLPTEGAGSINDLTRRQDLLPLRQEYAAGNKAPLEDIIKKDYVKVDEGEIAALRQQFRASQFGRVAPPDMEHLAGLEAKSKQAENLANWLSTSVPENLANQGLGFFDRHPHLDLLDKAVRDETRILKAEGLHQAIAKVAESSQEGVPLAQVLERAGLTLKDEAMARTMQALQAEGKIAAGATIKDLEKLSIPADQVDRLARFTKAATSPTGLKPVLDIWDSLTNLTKGFQTAMWPANWARNQMQAVFQNFVHDAKYAGEIGPMGYIKPFLDAKAWREGGVLGIASKVPGLEHLSVEAASDALKQEIAHLNVAGGFKHAYADIAGGEIAAGKLLPEAVGAPRQPFKDILKEYPTNLTKPFSVAGVGENLADTFGPIKAGRAVNQELDAVNRVATYLAKRSQGFTPEAALAEVKLAHFDFGNLTSFEKDVMKRVIPFYSWARQNIPSVLTQIAENPGGKMATSIKATVDMKGEHPGFLPSYISEGVAAPIGKEDNGQQRFLTHLGLGFEDVGQLLGPGGPLGMLNPLIKAPIEQLTGKQMFTGRDLRDLHSRLGDLTGTPLPVAENAIMNSPVGRLLSTAGTLTDDRKSVSDKLLNLLTGTRVSDVDMDAQRRFAVRDYIDNMLHAPGVNRFESLSVKPDAFQWLSPMQQNLYQLYRAQNQRRPALPSLQ